MKNRYLHILILSVILVVGLTACEMKASTPPPPTENGMTVMETIGADKVEEAAEGGAAPDAAEGEAGVAGSALSEGTTVATPAITSETSAAETSPPAPTNTPSPVPTSTPGTVTSHGVPASYTLHKGEHPFCLGRRFNIDPDALLAHNSLVRGVILYPGHTLQIPTNAKPFPGNRALKSHPDSYTVLTNDTFYSIACLYGDVYPEAIAEYNNMSVSQNLNAGTVIHIP